MGFNFRKRIRLGKKTGLNVSKSGISLSQKAGPVTFNSRGRTTVRLGNGLSYTTGLSSIGCLALPVVGIILIVRFFWVALVIGLAGFLLWKYLTHKKPPAH